MKQTTRNIPLNSRRSFLKNAGSAAVLGLLGRGLKTHRLPPAPYLFEEVPPNVSGLNWVHDNAISPERYLPETLGPGVAFLDYDNDGWMDIYLVNSGPCDFFKPAKPIRNALYKNNRDGTFTDVTEKAGVAGGTFGMGVAVGDYNNDGFADIFVTSYGKCVLYRNNGNGTFTDVTEKAGVGGERHYGQGVAVGDFDNDGYPDLYVAGYERAILYHNNGNGTFTDITAKAGVADEGGWSTSAGWFDYDKDGWLDLVVTNYIEWSPKNNVWCGEQRPGYRSYCHPGNYKGQRIKLYHNNHDGTFRDVSDASGVGKPETKGMGVVLADFNNDS